jgi:hypothetical protein
VIVSKQTRDLLQLALGSPQEPDANFALAIILDGLLAEAELLTGQPGPLDIAHQCRLEALKKFVGQYMTVSWRETDEAHRSTGGESEAAE